MIVCLCNSFNDKTVRAVIQSYAPDRIIVPKDIKQIYKLCANGENPHPGCGKCVITQIKDMVDEHNEALRAQQPSTQVMEFIPTVAIPTIPPPGAGKCGNCKCGTGGPRCI